MFCPDDRFHWRTRLYQSSQPTHPTNRTGSKLYSRAGSQQEQGLDSTPMKTLDQVFLPGKGGNMASGPSPLSSPPPGPRPKMAPPQDHA